MIEKVFEKLDQNELLSNSDIEEFFKDSTTDEDRKSFLLKINEKGVDACDVAIFVKFLLPERIIPIDEAMDICGTGGSGLSRINTSTITSFIVSACGVPIVKHGNKAGGGRFGSFDLLEKLGFKTDLEAEELVSIYNQEKLAFIFARKFFPAMRYFATIRQELGVPTIFNLLGPLLNPANPKRQIIGTNSVKNARIIAYAAKLLGKEHVMVIVGEDGLDEITLTGKTHCVEMDIRDIREWEVSPEDFGLNKVSFEKIAGGDAEINSQIALDILSGNSITEHKNLVLANAAFILVFNKIASDYKEGVKIAEDAIRSGAALRKYEKLKEISNSFAK